jgi:hypothetical protein
VAPWQVDNSQDGPGRLLRRSQRPWAAQLAERRRIAQPAALTEDLGDGDCALLEHWLHGYCVVSNIVDEELIDAMVAEMDGLWTAGEPIEGLTIPRVRPTVSEEIWNLAQLTV